MRSANTQKYTGIDFSEDRTWRERELASKNTPWKFQNLLPYEINVYVFTPEKLDLIGTIGPQGSISVTKSKSGMPLKADDEIHILRPTTPTGVGFVTRPAARTTKQYEIARPVWLFADSRLVRIGDIVYEDRVAFSNAVDISHDMIGLRIHNHLTMGLDIYYKGLKIAQIEGDDGTSFMSGSPNSVYLNNERFGFNIDDEISFVFTYDQKPYAKIRLIDNYTSDIIVGQTTQKFVPAIQDMFAYRIDEPNVNGTRYFDQVTAYTTTGRASGTYGPKGSSERSDGASYTNILVSQKGIKL